MLFFPNEITFNSYIVHFFDDSFMMTMKKGPRMDFSPSPSVGTGSPLHPSSSLKSPDELGKSLLILISSILVGDPELHFVVYGRYLPSPI